MSINFKILLGLIISLLIICLGFCIYKSSNTQVSTDTSLIPIIYNEIKKKQTEIDNFDKNEITVDGYKNKLQDVAERMTKINLFPNAKIEDTNQLVKNFINLKGQLNASYFSAIYNISYGSSGYDPQSLSNVDAELNDIFGNIRTSFYTNYQFLFDSSLMRIDNLSNNQLATFTDTSFVRKKNNEIVNTIKFQISAVNNLKSKLELDKGKLENTIKELNESLSNVDKSSKDKMLIYIVIPLFSFVVLVLLAIPAIYQKNASVIRLLFEQDIIIQVFAIFILVITILLLGIGEKIKSETIGTLLGGISVYVLQGALGNNSQVKDKNKNKMATPDDKKNDEQPIESS